MTGHGELTAILDDIAGELEAVDPRLALAIDRVSDRLENKLSSDWARPTPDEKGLGIEKKVNKNSIAYKRGLKDGNEKTGRPFLDGVDNYRYEVGSQEYSDYKAGHADAY